MSASRQRPVRSVLTLALALLWAGCSPSCRPATDLALQGAGEPGPPLVNGRCELSLDDFIKAGTGSARAAPVEGPAELIGGPNAQGKIGDFLLENDRIRVIVQGPDRHIGAQPFGGTLLDADLRRSGAGKDQLGELGLLYNFGRTLDPSLFEILANGSSGGPAILAVSGLDAANDYLSIRNQLQDTLGHPPVADPYVAVPLLITNYFILNPGEQRVRFVTAFCNLSRETQSLSVGDLTDPGGSLEFLNGQSCTGGMGYGGSCFGLDRMSWYGYLGDGVAYGYAPYQVGSPTIPEPHNAMLTVAGINGSLIGGNGLSGLLSWFDPSAASRAGELLLPGLATRAIARDVVVGRDLGEVTSIIETTRAAITGAPLGQVRGLVTSGGVALPQARVAFVGPDELTAVFSTDAQGKFAGTLRSGSYNVSAWALGHAPSAAQPLTLSTTPPAPMQFSLVAPRLLTVTARQAGGGPMPAKVTVLCGSGVCPSPASGLLSYTDSLKDPVLDGIARVEFVPASGTVTLQLPPGVYSVLVSRGPEYSIFPNSYPATGGKVVDLTSADGRVDATLAHVIDTTGYLSADFHVHAVNSPDSTVDNLSRVLGFAADGLDVIVSTDHDYVTDYAPMIAASGLSPFISSVVGEEVSTMDHGHVNLFPIKAREDDPLTSGALDWAGGRGPTLSTAEIFTAGRERGATTVHFNHPRGFLGGLTLLRADTDTLATHVNPIDYRIAVPPEATAADSKLLSNNFNAYEVLNPTEDFFDRVQILPRFNDWFTLLSRGIQVAGTGVSDSHHRSRVSGYRTFVKTGTDSPEGFDPIALSTALNALKASATNGPFVTVSVYRVDAGGAQVSPPVSMGEVLPPSPQDIGVRIDVQVPEYLDITKVELYLHRPEDDASCPLDGNGPNATTTRVACNGNMNLNWPASGVAASQTVSLTAGDLETVISENGTTYRRYHRQVTFRLPSPQTDNWLVAFVYGSRSLFPLLLVKQGSGASTKPVLPFAFTNPVFLDADGNGYDHPPFSPPPHALGPRPLGSKLPPPAVPLEERLRRWGEFALGE